MQESTEPNQQLLEAVKLILNHADHQETVEHHLRTIHAMFAELTDISGMDQEIELLAAVPTARGSALGLNHAAHCLLDTLRTVRFLSAITRAINDLLEENPDKTVNVFYAGCGPYAPFVSLVAGMYSADQLQFSVLEVNEKSLDSAKQLIDKLGLNSYVKDYFLADAVTFKIPEGEKYDILFSETLDAMLNRECYVPILFNLLPQLSSDVIVLPENVTINLSFVHKSEGENSDNATQKESPKATLVDVRKAIKTSKGKGIPSALEPVKVELKNMEAFESLIMDTRVHIYKDIYLNRGESSLSLPLEMKLEQPFPDCHMTFTYSMEPQIELKYELKQIESIE